LKKPSRANGKETKFTKEFLIARCRANHGKVLCEVCLGKDCLMIGDKFIKDLIVEHKDNNPNNWAPENLRLASQSCNMKEWHKNKDSQISIKVGIENQRERERGREGERGKGRDKLLKAMAEVYEIESLSMWKSVYSKSKFLEYVETEMLRRRRIRVNELIRDGARLFHMSRNKLLEYLENESERTGPYLIVKDEERIKWLEWKLSQLEKLYKEEVKKFNK